MPRSKKAIRFSKPDCLKWIPFLAAILIAVTVAIPSGRAEEKAGNTPLQEKFTLIEKRLAQIEEDQKKILQGQDEILKKLDTLRIWVRRN